MDEKINNLFLNFLLSQLINWLITHGASEGRNPLIRFEVLGHVPAKGFRIHDPLAIVEVYIFAIGGWQDNLGHGHFCIWITRRVVKVSLCLGHFEGQVKCSIVPRVRPNENAVHGNRFYERTIGKGHFHVAVKWFPTSVSCPEPHFVLSTCGKLVCQLISKLLVNSICKLPATTIPATSEKRTKVNLIFDIFSLKMRMAMAKSIKSKSDTIYCWVVLL